MKNSIALVVVGALDPNAVLLLVSLAHFRYVVVLYVILTLGRLIMVKFKVLLQNIQNCIRKFFQGTKNAVTDSSLPAFRSSSAQRSSNDYLQRIAGWPENKRERSGMKLPLPSVSSFAHQSVLGAEDFQHELLNVKKVPFQITFSLFI